MINSSRVAGIVFACATFFLCACTTAPPRQADTAVPTSEQPFAIDGRLSAKRGSEGAAANFAWNHDVGRDRIDFASPLGQVYARIDGNNDRIVVERPGGATETYPDWRSLTVALLGAPVPMDDLSFWIRGAARAGTPVSVERDAQSRVLVLRQREWEIVYSYPDNASAALPSRIFLKQQGSETVEVRIVVDRWGAALAAP